MGEAQEVERLRSALPPFAPTFGRISAELNQPRFIGMQSQSEFAESFPDCFQKRPRRSFILKAHHTIIGVAQHDDLSLPWLFTPALNPQVEGVVQVDIRQQWRDYCPLRSSLDSGNPLSVFDHTRREPFADQTYDPLISDPVREKPEHPRVIDFIEKLRHTLPTSSSFQVESQSLVHIMPLKGSHWRFCSIPVVKVNCGLS